MTQWYVKDLSKLTGVTVQTLHHYDRIDLLKPSVRLENGYRVYSEKDLLKLQQIIALKFFGFELAHIKQLLATDSGALQHFAVQVQVLERKAKALHETSQTLKNIIAQADDDKSIPWQMIIKLIEVYNMTQQLEQSWLKEIFTPEEMKQYATFESGLKTGYSAQQKAAFEKNWQQYLVELKQNLAQDPRSAIGIRLGGRCMELVNGLYGKKYAHLRNKKFEKGFAEGKGLDEVGFTPEIVAWLEVAMDAYWHQRVYDVLQQVGNIPAASMLRAWNEVLDDMCGEDAERRQMILAMVLDDQHISNAAKQWLKGL